MKRLILCVLVLIIAVAVSAQSRVYEDGYRGNVEMEVGALLDNYMSLGILTSHGYGTSYGLYAGIGTGLICTPNYYSFIAIPVFTDVKYNFTDQVFSPFVRMRLGSMINTDNYSAGVYYAPSVGVDMGCISIAFSYNYNEGKTLVSNHHSIIYHRHAFDVGLAWWF